MAEPSVFVRRVADAIQFLVLALIAGLGGAVWTMNTTITRLDANYTNMESAVERQVRLFEGILERLTVGGFNAAQGKELTRRVGILETKETMHRDASADLRQGTERRMTEAEIRIETLIEGMKLHGRDFLVPPITPYER